LQKKKIKNIMEKQKVSVKWLNNLSFSADVNGHEITMDAAGEVGGENKGPRPKPLLLAALAGCTGMDVVSVLKENARGTG
jgi:putative redox protein